MKKEQVLLAIKKESEHIENRMKADLAELQPTIDGFLAEVLEYGLFNGGKRIRPFLVVMCSKLCGGNGDLVYSLACAFEYLHAATLFHDDIIDDSDTRRGCPTVCRRFGVSAAILAGDFLHAYAMSTVGRLSGDGGLKVFCEATTGMVDGEFVQLRNSRNYTLSELDYYDAIKGKTGLLISAACEIGAMYGGGNDRQVSALRCYGENLGCAFQIVDDLLDYQGDSKKTGKGVGNDFIEGKMTLPLIIAMKRAGKDDRSHLLSLLSDKKERKDRVVEVCSLIDKYNGFELARLKAGEAVDTACGALSIFHDSSFAREKRLLEELAFFVLTRER
ncbi:polyprenyl synthetase [Desulfomarina profundi]|uniref:Polyprenyl synthetase n=1 Tax=Desulfomarina profundi TaxID=2772557 RepID=A0A8D5FIV4_9BACT|nr:polyprenyl synthetase family protein [Desulfomarina profundi]BCL59648.1 polyprenyl synthetase [Desulfomarina profundi]